MTRERPPLPRPRRALAFLVKISASRPSEIQRNLTPPSLPLRVLMAGFKLLTDEIRGGGRNSADRLIRRPREQTAKIP